MSDDKQIIVLVKVCDNCRHSDFADDQMLCGCTGVDVILHNYCDRWAVQTNDDREFLEVNVTEWTQHPEVKT